VLLLRALVTAGWYLAADMQFYVVTPILLVIYLRNKYFGFAVTGMSMTTS